MAGDRAIGAAILAGGQSRRMGTNKALLRAYADGPTIIEQVVSRVREAGLEPDLLVTNSPQDYGFLGLPMMPDDVPGAGSLGGILTALEHSPFSRTLVVGCDMPLLSPLLIRYMVAVQGDYYALVPRWVDEEGCVQRESLHSIYSQGCIEPIRKRIELGRLRVMDMLDEISVCYVEEAELRRYDPDLTSFCNINTPEDWAETRVKMQSRGS